MAIARSAARAAVSLGKKAANRAARASRETAEQTLLKVTPKAVVYQRGDVYLKVGVTKSGAVTYVRRGELTATDLAILHGPIGPLGPLGELGPLKDLGPLKKLGPLGELNPLLPIMRFWADWWAASAKIWAPKA